MCFLHIGPVPSKTDMLPGCERHGEILRIHLADSPDTVHAECLTPGSQGHVMGMVNLQTPRSQALPLGRVRGSEHSWAASFMGEWQPGAQPLGVKMQSPSSCKLTVLGWY